MTAQPVFERDPEDPVEILHVLPGEYHAQFRAEYAMAVDGARHPERYRQLQELLHLWHLRAIAYSSPGYAARLAAASDERADAAPADQVVRGWPSGRS